MVVIGGVGLVLLLLSLIGADVHHSVLEAMGPDWLTGLAVAGFLAAFGFVGALVVPWAGSAVAIFAGLLAGVGVGALAGAASRQLMRPSDDATLRNASLIGQQGTVIQPVPLDGYGVVNVVVTGQITRLNARGDAPLEVGTPIVVTQVLSPTSVRVATRHWP